MRATRLLLAAGIATCTAALVLVTAEAGAGAWVEERVVDTPQPVADPAARAMLEAPVPDDLVPALPLVLAGPPPAGDELAAAIDAVPLDGLGGGLAGVVLDAATGETLYDRAGGTGAMPASTMKVLTAVAALEAYGPDHVFTTRVVRTAPDAVVLVGGGDPYLSSATQAADHPERATVEALAVATAARLRAEQRTEITLHWDASLFTDDPTTGAGWQADWPATYADQVSPVSALVVDQARLAGTSPGPRSTTPAEDAARAFAEALGRQGVKVVSRSALETAAAGEGELLAAVDSAPLAAIVEDLLVDSDNDAAEVVAHHVGLARGGEGSFAGAAAGVEQVLRDRGLWDEDAVVRDGSGLSRSNRLTPAMLAGAVALATEDPELRPVLSGLPVAAATGTLTPRFAATGTDEGRGRIRAKTGTLSGASGLAGYAVTGSGAVVTFAFVVNEASADDAARVWLDRVTTELASS